MQRLLACARHGRSNKAVVGTLTCALCLLVSWCVLTVLHAASTDKRRQVGQDLLNCTRVEIEVDPSVFVWCFPSNEHTDLLSIDEMEHLKLLKMIRSDNREAIDDVARMDLSDGEYRGLSQGEVGIRPSLHITGYREDKAVVSFTIFGDLVRTHDGHEFRYRGGFPYLRRLMTLTVTMRQVRPLETRVYCAKHLSEIYYVLSVVGNSGSYPPPPEWSNRVLQHWSDWIQQQSLPCTPSRLVTTTPLECPSARVSHYAMNPSCKPESPGDMVLLFETKAGWNQHGGPDLFAFDNHDPQGGCVLLNDGTVKFIRTEGELRQLRWK